MKPTIEQFTSMQALFEYFNVCLFDGKLPNILLNLSRKGPNTGGFFAPSRWKSLKEENGQAIHEISLNPECLRKDTKTVVSILVHEMAHLWQQEFGEKKSRSGYHNKEWGAKMEEIGLMPSDTGQEGGKKTGQSMSHYIIPGGKFDVVYEQMDKDLLLPFQHIIIPAKNKTNKNKVKYTCPTCDSNVWGKEGLHIICEDCQKEYHEN